MLNFKTLSEDRIRETFRYNTDYILNNLIPEKTLEDLRRRENFVLVAFDEIFVKYPTCPDYYVSSYGRCISIRRGDPHLKKEPADGSGHVVYKFYKKGSQRELNISAQRAVADIFLPNFWTNLTRRQLETHHLYFTPGLNRWKDLFLCPIWIHKVMNEIADMKLLKDGDMIHAWPLDIYEMTGVSIDEIIKAISKKERIGTSGKFTLYSLGDYTIAVKYRKKPKKQRYKGKRMGRRAR